MKSILAAVVAVLIGVASAVNSGLAPPDLPKYCNQSYEHRFVYYTLNVTHASNSSTSLFLKRAPMAQMTQNSFALQNGVLTDLLGRTGYIAANRQFQFDYDNGQAGTIWNTGFSICPNNTMALQSAIWFACLSGTFFNLYDVNQGAQCHKVFLEIYPTYGPLMVVPSSSLSITTTGTHISTRIVTNTFRTATVTTKMTHHKPKTSTSTQGPKKTPNPGSSDKQSNHHPKPKNGSGGTTNSLASLSALVGVACGIVWGAALL